MGGNYWLASYPKSGNTWMRAFVYNVRVDAEVPADINDLASGHHAAARPWLDDVLGFATSDLSADEVERLRPYACEWIAQGDSVGYHKIHDAFTPTVDGVPIVGREGTLGALYIIRNPLDVAPSAAHHWGCTLDDAIHRMAVNQDLAVSVRTLPTQVRQRLLTWSEHVLSWVDAPGLRVAVTRYEDLLDDPLSEFARVAEFLELPHDGESVRRAVRFSSFEELSRQEQETGFRERPRNAERFFRSGRHGGWREALSDEQVHRVVAAHREVMRRFGYLDAAGEPR